MEANGNINNQKSSFVAKNGLIRDDKPEKTNILKGIYPKKKRSMLRKSTSQKVSTILDNLESLQTNIPETSDFMDYALFLQYSYSLG